MTELNPQDQEILDRFLDFNQVLQTDYFASTEAAREIALSLTQTAIIRESLRELDMTQQGIANR